MNMGAHPLVMGIVAITAFMAFILSILLYLERSETTINHVDVIVHDDQFDGKNLSSEASPPMSRLQEGWYVAVVKTGAPTAFFRVVSGRLAAISSTRFASHIVGVQPGFPIESATKDALMQFTGADLDALTLLVTSHPEVVVASATSITEDTKFKTFGTSFLWPASHPPAAKPDVVSPFVIRTYISDMVTSATDYKVKYAEINTSAAQLYKYEPDGADPTISDPATFKFQMTTSYGSDIIGKYVEFQCTYADPMLDNRYIGFRLSLAKPKV